VIHGRKRGYLPDQRVQQATLDVECVVTYLALGAQYDGSGSLWVTRQQPPVDIATVAQVGIVAVGRCHIQHILYRILCSIWIF